MASRDLRISKIVRNQIKDFSILFKTDTAFDSFYKQAQEISYKFNTQTITKDYISASKLNACAILHLLYQTLIDQHLENSHSNIFSRMIPLVSKNNSVNEVLSFYAKEFPSPLLTAQYLSIDQYTEETARGFFVHRVMTHNPALMKAIRPLIYRDEIKFPDASKALSAILGEFVSDSENVEGSDEDLFSFLLLPSKLHPDSLTNQISFILEEWSHLISEDLRKTLIKAIDITKEENKPVFHHGGAKAETYVPDYSMFDSEYEAFTDDRNWMPNVVMIAKSVLVWLDQLSKYYNRPVRTLDQIPDEELDTLKQRGFNALWLIGLWERSDASKTIKNLCGNPEAEASAYSLKNNNISHLVGGWAAYECLNKRCEERGIRLASDMVPNHTGIDSDWVIDSPELFIQQSYPPFPAYTYNGPNLSTNPNVELRIEDHYYDQTDAAVTFQRYDKRTGETSYIFHGNDGTSMPWNDTAQLDFMNPLTREAVFQEIRHVAEHFSIIRFDAAMTLAKKHIQRLWYPKLGQGGDIAGRTLYSMSDEEFNNKIPKEFWREVVDRMAEDLPDTLLLAEAFWMMEGYFVRTLGMHRVYNSAFMNMLKNQENAKYINSIKTTLSFDPEILKRYVNFMSNPDEETAIAQFGDGDKYFGATTLLATMPGLPMFGHGQIEGLKEKYGMEYSKAYWDEVPNDYLVNDHYKRIFPLLKLRYLFSGSDYFDIYDLVNNGHVHDSAFCYSNGTSDEKAVVFYNNQYESVEGYIKQSAPKLNKEINECVSSTIAQNLNLTLSGRGFLVYKNFNDGLTYLTPSLWVYDNGFKIALNGYETKVLLDIREIQDTDGTYAKLHEKLAGKGVKDINVAITEMRLQPIYNSLETLRSSSLICSLEKITKGLSSSSLNRKTNLEIAQLYSTLNESYKEISSLTKAYLFFEPKEVDPNKMLKFFEKFTNIFKDHKVLSSAGYALDELPIIVASSLFVYPFINGKHTIEEISKFSHKLLLSNFFSENFENLKVNESERKHIIEGAAIIISAFRVLEDDPIKNFKLLFNSSFIKKYTLCNEYQGITWYKKEAIQELIILSAISLKVFSEKDFDLNKYVSYLLEKEGLAEYQLDLFLKSI